MEASDPRKKDQLTLNAGPILPHKWYHLSITHQWRYFNRSEIRVEVDGVLQAHGYVLFPIIKNTPCVSSCSFTGFKGLTGPIVVSSKEGGVKAIAKSRADKTLSLETALYVIHPILTSDSKAFNVNGTLCAYLREVAPYTASSCKDVLLGCGGMNLLLDKFEKEVHTHLVPNFELIFAFLNRHATNQRSFKKVQGAKVMALVLRQNDVILDQEEDHTKLYEALHRYVYPHVREEVLRWLVWDMGVWVHIHALPFCMLAADVFLAPPYKDSLLCVLDGIHLMFLSVYNTCPHEVAYARQVATYALSKLDVDINKHERLLVNAVLGQGYSILEADLVCEGRTPSEEVAFLALDLLISHLENLSVNKAWELACTLVVTLVDRPNVHELLRAHALHLVGQCLDKACLRPRTPLLPLLTPFYKSKDAAQPKRDVQDLYELIFLALQPRLVKRTSPSRKKQSAELSFVLEEEEQKVLFLRSTTAFTEVTYRVLMDLSLGKLQAGFVSMVSYCLFLTCVIVLVQLYEYLY